MTMRVSNRWKTVDKPNKGLGDAKFIGMGASPKWSTNVGGASKEEQVKRFIGMVASAQNTPTYNVPTIDSVTLHFDGPLTDTAIQGTFSNVINPLGANEGSPPEGCTQVDTTFAEPGKFQTFALVCAIQWRMDFEPFEFTVPVNGWTAPTSAAAKPVSPDAFVVADLAANGTLGLLAGQTMVPGNLEWANWTAQAFYYMTLGYNLQWQYGHNYNIINDNLRYTAYVDNAQQQSGASSSEVDTEYYVRTTNDYYRNVLNSPFTALTVDHTRLGNMTLPVGEGGTAGLSVFRPTRAYERVGTTFGGASVRSRLKGNSEFRKLTVPFLAWPGVPLGLKAVVSSSDDQLQMQNFLSATYGFGGSAPSQFTEDKNILVGPGVAELTTGLTSQEPSLDAGNAPHFVQMLAQCMPFKGGRWKLTVAFKGYELTPDQASVVQNIDMRTAISQECSCQLGVPGGGNTGG
jgi:hypothetical protein